MSIINQLPFYHGSCRDNNNGGFPHVFDAKIYLDEELEMFRLSPTKALNDLLNKVYIDGSLVDGSISNQSGSIYVNSLVDFIQKCIRKKINPEILEIGFGSGIILNELKKNGYKNLIGIEPGNHKLLGNLEGITLYNDFFPSTFITKKLDLIYHFAVWEHILDPIDFIKNQLAFLKEDGIIVFGVPNCEPYIENGDVSIFIHEHFNYFTSKSIFNVVNLAGASLVDLQEINGMLVGAIRKKSNENFDLSINFSFSEDTFWELASSLMKKLKNIFLRYKPEKSAIYVPGRALNFFYLMGINNFRLIEDNSEMKGKFLPFFINPIESFDDLCANPPDLIFIFSRTFEKKIKHKCLLNNYLKEVDILSLNEL